MSRVRPRDPAWPPAAAWDRLKRDVGGRLIEVRSPFAVCRDDPVGLPCSDLFRELKNPYYVGDDPALTQTAGWVDAWTAQPSVFAVAAETLCRPRPTSIAIYDFPLPQPSTGAISSWKPRRESGECRLKAAEALGLSPSADKVIE